MSVVAINIAICNTALIIVGAEEINSFDDETRQARVCAQVYDRIARSRMEGYPWRFTMKTAILSKLTTETPAPGYESVFQLPGDRLRAVFKSMSGPNYRIYGDKLHAHGDSFTIEYSRRAPEEIWTESFRHMMELEMCAILCIALYEDETRADKYTKPGGILDRQTRIAKSVDGQQQFGDAPDESQFTLVAVRNNGPCAR